MNENNLNQFVNAVKKVIQEVEAEEHSLILEAI